MIERILAEMKDKRPEVALLIEKRLLAKNLKKITKANIRKEIKAYQDEANVGLQKKIDDGVEGKKLLDLI